MGPDQTAYVNVRFIDKCKRLILDIIEVHNLGKLSTYLMRIDFEKHLMLGTIIYSCCS